MKRLFLLIMLLLFTACTGAPKVGKVKTRILEAYEKTYPEEEFYFLYGPDYDGSWGRTTVRYRSILTSKKLEDLDYHNGFQINLEKADSPIPVYKYRQTLKFLDVFAPLKKEAKSILGDDIIFQIKGTLTNAMHKNILERIGKNMPIDKKTGFRMIIFSAFVDDLDKELENIDYWKEKIYQVGKRYWEYYNILGALQIYLYDDDLLQEPELVEASLGMEALADEKIKLYLDKLRNGQKLDKVEESYIINKIGDRNLIQTNDLIGIYFFTKNFQKENELNVQKVKIKIFKNNNVSIYE